MVRIYGYCLEPPTVCIIMELLPSSLKHRLRHGAPSSDPASHALAPAPTRAGGSDAQHQHASSCNSGGSDPHGHHRGHSHSAGELPGERHREPRTATLPHERTSRRHLRAREGCTVALATWPNIRAPFLLLIPSFPGGGDPEAASSAAEPSSASAGFARHLHAGGTAAGSTGAPQQPAADSASPFAAPHPQPPPPPPSPWMLAAPIGGATAPAAGLAAIVEHAPAQGGRRPDGQELGASGDATTSGGSGGAGATASGSAGSALAPGVPGSLTLHPSPSLNPTPVARRPPHHAAALGPGGASLQGAASLGPAAVQAQAQQLAGSRLTMLEVLRVSRDVATGLAFLHTRPVPVEEGESGGLGEGQGGEGAGVRSMIVHRGELQMELCALDLVMHSSALKRRGWRRDSACCAWCAAALSVRADIKPDNVLLNSRGVAKISDFGLARAHDSTTVYSGERRGKAGTTWRLGVASLRTAQVGLLLGRIKCLAGTEARAFGALPQL